jgi:PAS domain S-box-containing protein
MPVSAGEQGFFLLGMVAVFLVAVVDVLLSSHASVVELTVAGPVIAALGASPAQTRTVAVAAFLVSIPLGFVGDNFASTDHLIGVMVVGLVGVMAVVLAALRVRRERDASRLAVQYGLARVLADAESLEASAPQLLATIGEPLGWDVGHLFEVREAGRLLPVGIWTAPGVDVPDFEAATRDFVVERGQGLPGQVWQSGQPAFLEDVIVQEDFLRADAARRSNLRGGMAFPIGTGGENVAVVEFFSRDPRPNDPAMLEVTAALGTLIGEFIEGLRTAEAVRQSEARKSALLSSALDGVIVIDHEGMVVEFNPAAELLFGHSADDALGSELAELVMPPALKERHRRALRRTVETGEASLLGRRIEMTGMRADGSEFPVELAINRIAGSDPPMFTGTVRDIAKRRRAEREREELLRLEQVARHDASEARDQLEAILSGVADAVTAQAADGRLLFVNEAAVELLGFDSREALLAAPLSAILDRFDILDESGQPFPVERLPGRRALSAGERSEVVVRFRVRATGEERWSAVKATPILDSADRVNMAINVIEDITTHKRAERAQHFLSESTAVLSSSLDMSEALADVAALAVPEVADWLAVDLVTDTGLERMAAAHADPQRLERARSLYRASPPDRGVQAGVRHVLATGRSELYSDLPTALARAASDGAGDLALARELGMRSAIVVPMTARGRTLGTLSLATDKAGRRLDENDLELAEELARRCATALDNARLFSERAYIARTLQESLLPAELPHIPGIEAAARFRPTGEGNEVGGDFYDLFQSGERGWTIVMGDVCGKGPDAAAVTALARYTLRAAAMHQRLPSSSLRLLNEALLRQRDDRRFCTVAYAYLETTEDGARVGFASGGHPLPLLVRTDGSVHKVGAPGTLLGVLPDPRFEDRSLSLGAGDALILYTDGVIESRGGDGILDEERLAELLGACAGAGADAIADKVEKAALAASDDSPRDDIAVLVLRVAS